ncbi:MAG: glycosyltransferase family 2 protein [Dysgonamonadaceae bacterium]
MDQSQKIGIVTVLYNSDSVLKEFFVTLGEQTYKNFILYVIDNKSPDNSLALSKELALDVKFATVIIENECNYGVAKGNNIGIKRAIEDGCDLVLLSNNDITIERDTIENLLIGLETRKADMAVPKIYFYDTIKIWAAGGYFQKSTGHTLHYGMREDDIGQYDNERQVGYAPTCFMLIRNEVFEHVGFMDENYFVYYDDSDFVYRALNKFNKRLWYVPSSLVHHKESTSTGQMSDFSVKYLSRNIVYFSLKNYSLLYALYVILLNFFYTFFVLYFKWPRQKWSLSLKSYIEGFKLYIKRVE